MSKIVFYDKGGKIVNIDNLPGGDYRVQYNKSPDFDKVGAHIINLGKERLHLGLKIINTDIFPHIALLRKNKKTDGVYELIGETRS